MEIRTKELNKILNDNKSGSLEILLKLKKHFLKYAFDKEYLINSTNIVGAKLKHFPAIKNFLKEFRQEIKILNHIQLKKSLEFSISEQENSIIDLFERHKSILNKYHKITTLSFSKTLLEIIKLWYKKNHRLQIFILESRPMFEGRNFAKELIKCGIKCHLIVDSMMNYAIQKSDCTIIGADQILKNGNVVNKIGSYPLALCAKAAKKPFYVISTEDKLNHKNNFIPEKYPYIEVWNYNHKKLKIINHYFEEIPASLITKILL